MNTRLLLRLAAVFAALTFTVHAATVPRWSVHEIALTATGKYANAYTEVEVTAVFTGPDGAVKTVRGFWDGGENFKVRFTPAVQGEWKYVVSAAPADPGLAQSGAFTCTAPTPGSHGFLRRDTAFPASFVFDDGTRHFACGTTYYGILANARAGDRWREAIEGVRRYGMNKVRFSLAPSSPCGASPSAVAISRQNNYGADGAPYFSANWRDTPEYGDVQRLADFFTTRGVQGGTQTFSLPDAQDWVIRLRARQD